MMPMVKRVFGRVDGVEVILQYTEGNRWSVPVPLDVDGEYVIEVIAEDGAGNQSYLAKMLFCVDSSKLCAHIVPVPYYAELLESGISAKVLPDSFYAELIEPRCELEGGGRCNV